MSFRSAIAVLVAAAGVFLGGFGSVAAGALPATQFPLPIVSEAAMPLVPVHGCHFDMGPGMAPDPVNGPHYHNRQCAFVRVGPQGGYGAAPRGYDDGARSREYRGDRNYGRGFAPPQRQPICRERCRYTGPFKQCRTVCE